MLMNINELMVIDIPLTHGLDVKTIARDDVVSVVVVVPDGRRVPVISFVLTEETVELIADVAAALAKYVANSVFNEASRGQSTVSLVAIADDFLKSKILPVDREVVENCRVMAARRVAAARVDKFKNSLLLTNHVDATEFPA